MPTTEHVYVNSQEPLTKENALFFLEELPKILFIRLKGKILNDVEEIIGKKILDNDGAPKKLPNGRTQYEPTAELTLAKKVITSKISKITFDLKNQLEAVITALSK